MTNIHIPIVKLPIFHKHLYNHIKEVGDYNLSFKFIEDNFSVVGHCGCKEPMCSTVWIQSKQSINKYKCSKPFTGKVDGILDHVFLKENGKPIEYEYLDPNNCNPAIFKSEVYDAVDKFAIINKNKQRIKKNIKIKNK